MATHEYPEGADPREVFADHIAQNTHGKSRNPREDQEGEGAERPEDRIPATDVAANRALDQRVEDVTTAIREQIEVERVRREARAVRGRYRNTPQEVFGPPPAIENLANQLYPTDINDYIQTPRYVTGRPPMTPVLRPIKQTMYSRVMARMGVTRMIAFQNAMGWIEHETGDNLTAADTNMFQAGMLGTPLQYDVSEVGVHPYGAGPEYKQRWDTFLNYNPEFVWIFGGNTHWLRTTVNLMQPRFPMMTALEFDEAQHRAHNFPQILQQLATDMVLPRMVDMTTPEGRMRRIDSTESFRAEINFVRRAWTEPFDFKVYVAMHGVLYTTI